MTEGSWKLIAARLAERIEAGEFAPGSRLPSGDQLARDLGINRNTAHRAIDELQRQGLVTRRQGSGTIVVERNKTQGTRIALLVDGYSAAHNFPSGDLLRGIHDRIGEDATLVIADSKHDAALEARQLRRLSREADGILIYPTAPDRCAPLASLVEEHYPVVALDRLPLGFDLDAAVTDNLGTTRKAARTLLGAGHQNIGFLGVHKPTFSSVADRLQGYGEAMKEAGMDADGKVRWVPDGIPPGSPLLEQIVQDTIAALRQGSQGITALFCAEDSLGCAAMLGCERLGLAVPSELEVATFIDWHPMTLRTPWNVRRIVQRKYELGQVAAGLLLDRLASPERPPQVVRIEADIIPADAALHQPSASPSAFLPTKEGPHS